MRTIGGEVGFVAAMIADSLVLTHSLVWYSSLLGKKSSLSELLAMLSREGIPRQNIRVTRFTQGKTNRWGIAWTFYTITTSEEENLTQSLLQKRKLETRKTSGYSDSSVLKGIKRKKRIVL